MTDPLPEILLVRHGETDWSRDHRHTGRTDVPLNARGEAAARALAGRLPREPFPIVWTGPASRAVETCRLAGFGDGAAPRADLAEWDYGAYEGRTTAEIRAERPGWSLFADGCPDGENAADVGARADRIIAELRAADTPALIFSSAHIMRVLAARWIGLPPAGGALLVLDTASISMLGYDHDRGEPAIRRWNQTA